ncbi:MAG: type III pantothenate kinase [Candidatus Azobacteroides sp.]|nr:type III pantothenate kinase [Candidatus Azobacteroides sp.]
MNLIIDEGNSAVKVAFFEENVLVKSFQLEKLDQTELSAFMDNFCLEAGILSTVNKWNVELYSFLSDTLPVFYNLNHYLPLPLAIDYQTPQTLGMDRIAAAVGAWTQKPNMNLLVIDLGTAITVDWVTDKGVYKGGNISPGPELRFKALHQFTNRLPLISMEGETPVWGYDTPTAIRSGVVEGIVREVDSYIEEYKKNRDVFAFLTGGYSFYFESKLKNSIFADGNLVLKGLNEILNYQKRKA